jgi:hypothetical protein
MSIDPPKFSAAGLSLSQIDKMLENTGAVKSGSGKTDWETQNYERRMLQQARRRLVARMQREEKKTKAANSAKRPLTDAQLKSKERKNREKFAETLGKQGIKVTPSELKPKSPSGRDLWDARTLRRTYVEWAKRNPGADPADFTMQHITPKATVTTVDEAIAAHHPKRVIGMTGPGLGGNYSQQDLTNPEYLRKTGIHSETAVKPKYRLYGPAPRQGPAAGFRGVLPGISNVLLEPLVLAGIAGIREDVSLGDAWDYLKNKYAPDKQQGPMV